jgi:hypothetical protein
VRGCWFGWIESVGASGSIVSFESRRRFVVRGGSSSSSSARRFPRLRVRDSPEREAGGDVASSNLVSSSTLDAVGKRDV